MLKIRNWGKWQRGILTNVRKMRLARGMDPEAPLSMQHVSLTVSWDRDFIEVFSPAVGPRSSETFLLRAFQYAAVHDGLLGRIAVPREEFGPIVLSRAGDHVGSKQGCKVYDAMLAARIAVPLDGCVTSPATGIASGSALPVPALPGPPLPGSGNGGGSSAAPPEQNGNGHAALSPADVAVLKMLVGRGTCVPQDYSFPSDRRTAALAFKALLKTGTPPNRDEALAFIDAVTPIYVEKVRALRITFAMADKQR